MDQADRNFVYEKLGPWLEQASKRVLGKKGLRKEQIEEIRQVVWAELLARDDWESQRAFLMAFYKTILWRFRDSLKKNATQGNHLKEYQDKYEGSDRKYRDQGRSPGSAMENLEQLEIIKQELERIRKEKDGKRNATWFLMRFFGDETYVDIARIYDVADTTVLYHVRKIQARIRSLLD
ncbi:MAG: hypothetical protein AAF939_10725 [Planctomycetota bacterium]